MIVLREQLTFDQAGLQIEESEGKEGKEKKLFMSGVFIQGGVTNLNQRVYPVSEIKRAVEAINKQIEDGYPVMGELDHPQELTINLDRVSHVIQKMWMEGQVGMGKLEILPTPLGNIAKTLIQAGVKLGVSSRGSGNVDYSGHVSDFEIVTVDIVAKPSAPNAYPHADYESFNSRNGAKLEDLARAVAHDPKAQKYLHAELLNWVNTLY